MKGRAFSAAILLALASVQWWGVAEGQLDNETAPALAPPAGNSPAMVVKTVDSYVLFKCVKGSWIRGSQYGTLGSNDTNAVVGNHSVEFTSDGEVGTWALINSPGDSAESGAMASVVTGKLLAAAFVEESATGCPAQLFVAASHRNDGAAATVSYIQMYGLVGGESPPREKCTSSRSYSQKVSVAAEFALWTQDAVPPPVPTSLTPPGRMVAGYFAKGDVEYESTESGWVESTRRATLHSVPGDPAIGQFWMNNGLEGWQTYDPNGITLHGRQDSPEMKVDASAMPWSLSVVTSQSGTSILGPLSHVQMVSTRGGLPPPKSINRPPVGTVWKNQFSAVFWLYLSV